MAGYNFELDFPTVLDWESWYLGYKSKHPQLNSMFTNYDSFASGVPDLTQLQQEMSRHKDDPRGLKDSIFGRAVVKLTEHAAPIKECAWLVNKTFITDALQWFETNKDQDYVKIWDASYTTLMSSLPSLEQVQAYQRAAIKFRQNVLMPKDTAFQTLGGEVLVNYKVNKTIITSVLDMLKDMENKRSALRDPSGAPSSNRKETIDVNSKWMMGWLNDEAALLDMPPWGAWDKTSARGLPIALTSIVKSEQVLKVDLTDTVNDKKARIARLMSLKTDEAKDFDTDAIRKMHDVLDKWSTFKTSLKATPAQTGEPGFGQQAAALDTVFSACYWLWKSGVSVNSFPALSKFLHELGSKVVGKTKLASVLKACGWKWGKGLLNIMSIGNFNGNKIHMHPAVLTAGRMSSDMVISFGSVPAYNADLAEESVGSIRSILNFETNRRNSCAEGIVKLWDVFCAGYEYQEEEIVPPEHMLHQSFLGKVSPFQNVSKREGDALKVHITS
ncbi:nucleoprotein [Orthonairovirus khani]|uniref:Nucleoprotein n=1 Tax=Orthonairovirus khani TaxID=3052525 RepID=A0A191KW92_9VIRU|nr:nucleoprotein [Orthonairovirus khani]AMT75391.1 nucleoprotein [Orthonairovirus khani]